MKSIRLIINGRPMHGWADTIEQIGGSATDAFGRNYISHRVLSPNESIVALTTDVPELARQFQAAIAYPENSIVYCYCSIFDECWLATAGWTSNSRSRCRNAQDSAMRLSLSEERSPPEP